jgi:cytoskeletal protein RodZ
LTFKLNCIILYTDRRGQVKSRTFKPGFRSLIIVNFTKKYNVKCT